eukprot:COSAG02_NODE_13330_length_1409_cov_1.200763_2_plen_134_part_00
MVDTEAVDSVEDTVTLVVSVVVLVAVVGGQAAFGGDSDFPHRGCHCVPCAVYRIHFINFRCSCAILFPALLPVRHAATKFHGIVNVSSGANVFPGDKRLVLSSLFAALRSFVLSELLLDPCGKSAAAPAIASW